MKRFAKHGVLSITEWRALGIADATVRARVRTGRWYRLYPGVISVVHPSMLRPEGWWRAAVLACGQGTALAGREAARLHALRSGGRTRIDVMVPYPRNPKHDGIEVHRSKTLRPEDVTEVKGIRVTTVSRTIFDCAGLLNRDQLERLIEEAEVQDVLDERALRELIELNRNTVAAKRLAELLDSYEYDRGAVLNDFEQRLRTALREAGAPPSLKNRWIVLPDGGPAIKPDFQWPETKLVLFADGFKYHRARGKFERDTRNDRRLIDYEWLPMRVTYRQAADPTECADAVRSVIRQLQLRTENSSDGHGSVDGGLEPAA
jgi:predicted transcriptional regulator of viral defense system